MFEEFGANEGTSPLATPQKFDIGWYLSAMLEDPLADEPLKSAINDWFTGNDETSLKYRSIIDHYQKDSEILLNLNKQLRSSLTDARYSHQVMYDANIRLKRQFDKLVKFVPIAALSSSLFSILVTYTVMMPK